MLWVTNTLESVRVGCDPQNLVKTETCWTFHYLWGSESISFPVILPLFHLRHVYFKWEIQLDPELYSWLYATSRMEVYSFILESYSHTCKQEKAICSLFFFFCIMRTSRAQRLVPLDNQWDQQDKKAWRLRGNWK